MNIRTIKTTSEFDRWEMKLKDRQAVAKVRVRIRRLSLGNPGDVRGLKAGVSEMRIDHGPGYRIYYTERHGEIVILLVGGTKKTQTADIALAQQMAKDIP